MEDLRAFGPSPALEDRHVTGGELVDRVGFVRLDPLRAGTGQRCEQARGDGVRMEFAAGVVIDRLQPDLDPAASQDRGEAPGERDDLVAERQAPSAPRVAGLGEAVGDVRVQRADGRAEIQILDPVPGEQVDPGQTCRSGPVP